MIPFVVKGVVNGFQCSQCNWSLILEQPFSYSNPARQARTNEVMHWYSEHDCSRFPPPTQGCVAEIGIVRTSIVQRCTSALTAEGSVQGGGGNWRGKGTWKIIWAQIFG